MEALASYAKTAQKHGMVPIVEPEVLINGEHSIKIVTMPQADQ